MKWNRQWKQLTRDQKAAWKTWAKNNPVRLEHGFVRRVSGEKAFTIVLINRAIAGEAANPTVVSSAATWLSGALSLHDAGPFTANDGFMGFRTTQEIVAATNWFVWATPPRGNDDATPLRKLRFIKCLSVPVLAVEELTPNFVNDYTAVNGSLNDPVDGGEWYEERYVWFQIRQYANGQLGPAQTMRGQIQLEL